MKEPHHVVCLAAAVDGGRGGCLAGRLVELLGEQVDAPTATAAATAELLLLILLFLR